ncbi:phenylacetate--CoA ligase family protein [Muricoccus radiodurans]|uniref:phenylacetate--CoA ligase family protein n=1 Tax=Muricoccus radiodurans TaxID=2231721 RepID=UPI003CF01251
MDGMAAERGPILAPEVETRSPEDQFARDRDTYRRQVAYLFERSPFYADKLCAAGFADAAVVGGLDDLPALPFTEKDEIRATQAEAPPFGRHLAADPATVVRVFSTSGTTGDPCYMPVTRRDLDSWITMSSRSYYAGGLRPGMRVVSTYNAGPFVAGAALDTLAALGVCHIPVGTGNTARLVRAMQLIRPEALLCTPSYAAYLAEHLTAQGIAPDGLGLRRICVAGEPGGGEAATRARLEAAFGVKLCEAMGIGDVSISLWGECDAQAGMHFNGGDHVHVELIDPATGQPVEKRDGATGELVYTALTREAAPLLRFRSRDHVVWHSSRCECGRTTPRVRCIGRTDDLLIVRGVNVFPSAIRDVVATFAPRVAGPILVRPTKRGVAQEPPLPVDVELPPDTAGDPALAEAIEKAVRAKLIVSLRVSLVPHGSIARSEYKTKLIDLSGATT